jgi:hypothetical protein
MSDFQALGGVSATLQKLLKDRMELPLGVSSVQVTVSTPPQPQNPPAVEDSRVNLFLYRLVENGYLKNQDLIGDGHPGAYGHPPLSLDLHYLLTAYGTTTDGDGDLVNENRAQQLLGSAMRVLHDHSIIAEDLLDGSLQHQVEQLKLSLDPLNLEDLSKVWTALSLPFRLSAAYTASVVQIESRRPRRMPRPVTRRRVHVAPLRHPHITQVYRTPVAGEPVGDPRVRILDSITIQGVNFSASKSAVKIGSLDWVDLAPPVADTTIELAVPDDPLLQPGPQVVQVRTERDTEVVEGALDHGQVAEDHAVLTSNQAVFLLVPAITPPVSIDPNGALLAVNGNRLFTEGLKSYVLVGDVAIEVRRSTPQDPVSWTDPGPHSVEVLLPALPSGSTHLVRVRVNGAESIEENVELTMP